MDEKLRFSYFERQYKCFKKLQIKHKKLKNHLDTYNVNKINVILITFVFL